MKFSDSTRDPRAVRVAAAELSTQEPTLVHEANTDEKRPYVFSFTKGLEHAQNGLLANPTEFEDFRTGTQSHDPQDFEKVEPYRGIFRTENLSEFNDPENAYRQWESPTAGHAFVLEGPDTYSVTMPPAPEVGSAEFAAEIAEVYQMALCRDMPIASFMDSSLVDNLKKTDGTNISNASLTRLQSANAKVVQASNRISGMRWFSGNEASNDEHDVELRARRRFNQIQTSGNTFRGAGEDGWETPFLSQFMIMGTRENRTTGVINYGAQTIDQKVSVAFPEKDFMTNWEDWLDVQNGLNKRTLVQSRGEESLPGTRRTMSRLRDLATYVHDDQLYQAYLNAALILLVEGAAIDPGIPYHKHSTNPVRRNNREPFALFGGPHLLTLVTEVSSRALKAVRLQKFSIHRRLRPEAAGALFHTIYSGYQPDRGLDGSVKYADPSGSSNDALARRQIGRTLATYTFPFEEDEPGSDPVLEEILTDIRIHNAGQNGSDPDDLNSATWLLPMAFAEGSPMHPAYGAGHATVAGACVTLLKTFFAMTDPKYPTKPTFLVGEEEQALVPDGGTSPDDTTIDLLGVNIDRGLTLEGELNKLMWNISNARNIAGVHYYTDYIESALLGEAITIGVLREQMLCYHPSERVEMTVPLLVPRKLPKSLLGDGTIAEGEVVSAVKIRSNGTLEKADPTPGRV